MLTIFRNLSRGTETPFVQRKLKRLYTILMALMSNMVSMRHRCLLARFHCHLTKMFFSKRSSNIHAMIPGGREFTKAFSPTRRRLIASEQNSKACVCCNQSLRPSIPIPDDDKKKSSGRSSRRKKRVATEFDMEDGQDSNDDDDDELVEEEENEALQAIPMCSATTISHYAHASCIKKLTAEGAACPRCLDFAKRKNFDSPGSKTYCRSIKGGFSGSSKINAVVDWYRSVPKDDKVSFIILKNHVFFPSVSS
jgi:hypothetical protein